MDPLRTAIVDAGPTHLRVRGHDVLQLMQRATFTDVIFLLHHTRLPTPEERRLLAAGMARADADATAFDAEGARIVDEARARQQRLPGFGHRVHADIDPR